MDEDVLSRLALDEPIPFAALNHFTTPCSLLNFPLLVRNVRHLRDVTPVGGARKTRGDGPAPLRNYTPHKRGAMLA